MNYSMEYKLHLFYYKEKEKKLVSSSLPLQVICPRLGIFIVRSRFESSNNYAHETRKRKGLAIKT